jgi:hypothetical protein
MALLCSRPHARLVDWASRFIVASSRGLHTGTVDLERGDEIPAGTLDAYALQCEYELHRIELLSFAATDSSLREACARKGVSLDVTIISGDTSESVVPIQDAVSSAEATRPEPKHRRKK